MKPSKAYILRIDSDISREYAKFAADSCDKVGLKWEYFEGYTNMSIAQAWDKTGLTPPNVDQYRHITRPDNPQCCSAGHAAIWNLISKRNECAIVLEHDAVMLQPVDIDIPEDRIVVLGYKLSDYSRYDHEKAGPPKRLIPIDGHEGAHAYAMTPNTATKLINEINTNGVLGCIDNAYFIRNQRITQTPLMLADPTPAIAWLRKSTLWHKSAEVNYDFIESFYENLK